MGIEHPRLEALAALSNDQGPRPAGDVYGDDGTPNQRLLGIANGLAVSRRWPDLLDPETARQRARDFAGLQRAYGHMCVGDAAKPGQSVDESFAPEPHGYLWGASYAVWLREADRQGLPDLVQAAVEWWGDHLAGLAAFWTPAGPRLPCARALSLPPEWVWDARAYALMVLGEDGSQAEAAFGNVAPPAQAAFDILRQQCARSCPAIRAQLQASTIELHTPRRRWDLPAGGFAAALAADSPLIDQPCGWLVVAAGGAVTASGRLLGDATPGQVPGAAPTQVVGDGRSPANGGQAPARAAALRAISAVIAGWVLPPKPAFDAERALQHRLAQELAGGNPTRPLAAIAADVASFGSWTTPVVEQLRALDAQGDRPG